MSILNVLVTTDAALVGVDTCALLQDGRMIEACKTVTLPHLSAVLAYRGSSMLLMSAASQVVGFGGGDFDALADALPSILGEVLNLAKDNLTRLGMPLEALSAFEFVLVGWSPACGRMQSHRYGKSADSARIEHQSDFGQFIAPYAAGGMYPGLDSVRDAQSMAAAALQQFNAVIQEPGVEVLPAGGGFYITEISKDHLSTHLAFRFPPR